MSLVDTREVVFIEYLLSSTCYTFGYAGFCIGSSHSGRFSCLFSSPSWSILCSIHLCYGTWILAQHLLTSFPACVFRSAAQASFTNSFLPSLCMAQDRMGHLHCPGFGEGLGARQPFWLIHACVTNLWVVMGWEYLSALTIIPSLVCRNSSHLASMWSTGWSRPLNSKP